MTIPTDRPDVEAMLPVGCEPIEVIISFEAVKLMGAKKSPKFIRQKNSWVDSGSGSLPSE
jgi:hypothetical protein